MPPLPRAAEAPAPARSPAGPSCTGALPAGERRRRGRQGRQPLARALLRCAGIGALGAALRPSPGLQVLGRGRQGPSRVGRREPLLLVALQTPVLAAFAADLTPEQERAAASGAVQPSEEDYELLKSAFAGVSVDPRLPEARAILERVEADLSGAIERFEGPLRGTRLDRVRLYMARAQARGKMPEKVEAAVRDYDAALRIMEEDLEAVRRTSEYPNLFVRRAMASEEVASRRRDPRAWAAAVQDYTRAIELWRGRDGDGLGVNPMVLNFRGSALSQLGRYEEAVDDYHEASVIFNQDRLLREASLSRASEALALLGAGRRGEGLAMLRSVIRRDPGVTDGHVALAAVYWTQGDTSRAEEEWRFACEKIEAGCAAYKDPEWVSNVRRWPPDLAAELQAFLQREVPTGA